MRSVTANEFQGWLAQGEVLEQDSHGVKVLRLPEAGYLKVFRSRRSRWLAWLSPEARRFVRNAQRLHRLGLHTPKVTDCFWLDRAQVVSACLYEPLQGKTLEQMYRTEPEQLNALIPDLARYILALHRKGIYFRSLHLGNILLLPGPRVEFGLIDFLDMRFRLFPLDRWQIRRNFAHLQSYLQRRRLEQFPFAALQEAYQQLRQQS
ncbi:lipopolysaccharide kinase (Kdo/WaaP) family protein [Azomonas agilis]|uniref:Lipopolysaccharide kinase (Kdo/WaaP) family protein n=1 Tax=Azomonas agilis TaxID=116849 RepID=A0A562I0I9_9GAMM|nr:lipopolysaccharide kinase InaA family protein [Azomonas agilis]TWH64557.1 lipopolysaccharide kinase (Kdo/WaaP) family protein [Azomonas agilis]